VTTVRIPGPLQPPRQRRVGAARVRPAHSMNDAGVDHAMAEAGRGANG
jgi:hypothetical protein